MPALTRTPSDRNDSLSPDPDSPDSYQPAYSAAIKRKASEEDLSDGPSQKNPHTEDSRKQPTAGPSRRKSTSSGAPPKDESRLLKRKEQNRAAQRAFRERKEKHVKDLEDKVADLEAKNEQAQHENENLRDLLQRLQTENVALKQSAFSFSMPSNIGSTNTSFSMPPQPQQSAPKLSNPLDWSSLTTFDPSILNLLDDPLPQPTATDGAMQLDFGFGHASPGLDSNSYTTIATNPLFMSFASNFDSVPASDQNVANAYVHPPQPAPPLPAAVTPSNNFTFDNMGGNFGWTPPPVQTQDMGFDDLFLGYFGSLTGNDPSIFHAGPSNPALSPISHTQNAPVSRGSPSSTSSLSSPLVSTPDSLDKDLHTHSPDTCPRTKSELKQRIEEEGSSPFAPTLRKSSDQVLGTMISCAGSKFPKTVKSDQNIEVLTAWRSIISDPQFKNVDVNELCQEFTSKARCDGTMVVLEPQGVHQIFESLAKK